MRTWTQNPLIVFAALSYQLALSPPSRAQEVVTNSEVRTTAGVASSGRPEAARRAIAPFALDSAGDDLVIVRWQQSAVRRAAAERAPVTLRDLPLSTTLRVDVDVTPFSVVGSKTQFVLGRKGGSDLPLDYDVSRISLFHGSVAGRPGSHVFLALGGPQSTGYIDVDGRRFLIASKSATGHDLLGDQLSVFPASGSASSLPPDVALCGVADHRGDSIERGSTTALGGTAASGSRPISAETMAAGGSGPRVGLRHMELAVETDFEYFSLFNDATAAADYLVAMYGQVSAIYMRDVDVRVELVYGRIWDQPDDLFNIVDPSPLQEFAAYWNTNMGAVHRDTAQLFSGRSDYPFGGQAYVSALCGDFAYGVVGYAMGFFPDPTKPSPYNYDVEVTAHELGHTSGTFHTHDYAIDSCQDPNTTPQRGTIMSYCSQTWSGGNANTDNYFHAIVQANIDAHVASVSCIPIDCNMNGVADTLDVFEGTSADTNGNGVPDECEDCNNNGVLDPADIAGGMPDLNGNGIPDACEPDCNGNGVPDNRDIALGTSLDAYGNDVPDECEADCNGNGISDYTEIQANMSLDIDRNAVLDSCQDCDSDGTSDLDALGGGHSLWVASGLSGTPIREFYANSGVLNRSSSGVGSLLAVGQDLIVTASGRILATSRDENRVAEYALDGNYLGDLVSSGAGGLSSPAGLIMTPSGALLVCSSGTHSVLRYDGVTGASLGAFVAPGSGGLTAPFGLTFGNNGNLFVTSETNEVLEFDGGTGAFVRVFVSAADNGGLLSPRGIAFKPDGDLLVASFATNQVLAFQHDTGKPLGKWAHSGTADVLTQVSPWSIRIGPNGNVFVGRTGEAFGSTGQVNHHDDPASDALEIPTLGGLHLTNAQIYEFDVKNGNFLRAHVNGNDHPLQFPTGFDFVPGWTIDCNLNLLPDSCDIASGFSLDFDGNDVPDECDVDCNGNGNLDRTDIIPYGASYDCNSNLVPDECDLSGGTSSDCNANGIPDECEADCNENGIPDECDITAGTATDCNGDGVPDECDPDCNANGQSDNCEIVAGTTPDCNANGIPDDCEADCNGNTIPDECDIASGGSDDCNGNQVPDECEIGLAPVVYLIERTDLVGLGNDCGGDSLYACAAPAGFRWTDTLAGSIVDVTIEFNIGVQCHSLGTVHDTTLNGAGAPTFVAATEHCTCASTPGVLVTIQPSPTDYVAQGENEFRIVNTTDCLGLIPSAALGGAFARVSVTPVGDCDGNGVPDNCDPDCNLNGIADGCDITGGASQDCNTNTVPDECDIAGGASSDDNGDGIPDECQVVVPNPPVGTGEPARTNRYLRFSTPASGAVDEVIRVTAVSLDGFVLPDPNVFYLGIPSAAPEEDITQLERTFAAAPLQCAPHARDWASVGVISAFGAEIMPGSTYDVQRAFGACPNLEIDESCWSPPLTIVTAKFGDLVDPFAPEPQQPDFKDIAACVSKFVWAPTAPIKAVAQLQPNVVFPDRPIDFKDIAADVQAFVGASYATVVNSIGPCICPSAVLCGVAACSEDTQCGSGFCIGGFCTDACGRCSP